MTDDVITTHQAGTADEAASERTGRATIRGRALLARHRRRRDRTLRAPQRSLARRGTQRQHLEAPAGRHRRGTRHDGHPPLYYYLLHGWMQIGGESDWWVRALSGLFGVASIPLGYIAGARISRRSGDDPGRTQLAALLTAAMVAVIPYGVRYGSGPDVLAADHVGAGRIPADRRPVPEPSFAERRVAHRGRCGAGHGGPAVDAVLVDVAARDGRIGRAVAPLATAADRSPRGVVRRSDRWWPGGILFLPWCRPCCTSRPTRARLGRRDPADDGVARHDHRVRRAARRGTPTALLRPRDDGRARRVRGRGEPAPGRRLGSRGRPDRARHHPSDPLRVDRRGRDPRRRAPSRALQRRPPTSRATRRSSSRCSASVWPPVFRSCGACGPSRRCWSWCSSGRSSRSAWR